MNTKKWFTAAAATTALVASVSACGTTTTATDGPAVKSEPSATPTDTPWWDDPEHKKEKPDKYELTKKDVIFRLKVTEKSCFGSAGCNVGFKVQPVLLTAETRFADDYDVTYKVLGGEDGPVVSTLVLYANGTYEVPWEDMVGTSSSSTELRVKTVSVEPTAGW